MSTNGTQNGQNGSSHEALSEGDPAAKSPRPRGSRPAKEPKRRRQVFAEEATLRARVDLSRALGDPAEERTAARKLAELLASRDVELDYAVELAFRSLSSSDDPTIRHLLAGWLEGLGEPGLAASELRKLASAASGSAAAAILIRIGALHARAGDAVGAQEAFTEAAEADDRDALPLELLGSVATWAAATHGGSNLDDVEGFPGPRVGAEAYVRAARRRAASRDAEGELEDLLRAFELDPTSPLATTALMGAYAVRDREGAADFVYCAHAAALLKRDSVMGPALVSEIHGRRRASALEVGNLGRALTAALDERLDAAFDGAGADAFDELLGRAGAYEPLAVRLEVRAEREVGRAAAVRWSELGRLLSGPLAAPDRALEAFAHAVARDAANAEVVHALRSVTQKRGDLAWLLEGLIRGAMGERAFGASTDAPSRLAAAHELAAVSEERNDPLLAAWAYSVMAELDPSDERAKAAVGRLESAVRQRQEDLDHARRDLEGASGDARPDALLRVIKLTRSAPGASEQLARSLLELAELRERREPANDDLPPMSMSHEEDPIFVEALRVAERVSDFRGIAKLAAARLESRGPNVRVRGILVSALRRSGDLAEASRVASVFAGESATRWTCSVAWIAAAAANDESTRGRALAAVAPACGVKVGSALSAVAGEILLGAGDIEAARAAAEHACRTEPESVRSLMVLARASLEAPSAEGSVRAVQAAVDRAMDVGGPSASFCARVADMLAESGDPRGAVTYARRRVTLRPGDPVATQALVTRAMAAHDAEALGDALLWLLPQPQPSKEMAERFAPALTALAKLDVARAMMISRRALDVLGPRHAVLRQAISEVVSVAEDRHDSSTDASPHAQAALRAALGERWIAAGAPAAERGPLLLDLTRHYKMMGNVDAELHAYARAARENVDLSHHAARIAELASMALSPDAELAALEAHAEACVDRGLTPAAADTFRDLGAAFWDTADDRPRAVQAWVRAAHCDSVHGYATLRRDLTDFANAQYAVDCLAELVDRETDRVRSGVIATQAARAALDVGAHSRALGLAKLALDRDPGRADALVTAEAACASLARVPEMSPIYDQVARRARGRFGRRAAHHRAARFFESGGVSMLALKHAAQAFIAVPSEGTTLSLLERTALKAQREGVAVRTVEHVAELARTTNARAGWLLRAAGMTARDLEGIRQKMDLLLKAIIVLPSPATLALLSVTAREIISLAPDDSAAVALRLERADDQLAKGLEGPDGARIALTFAEMAVDLFSDGEWAWRALERAIGADADVDEYVKLIPYAHALASSSSSREALTRVMAEVEKPYSNVGHALLRLVGAIAKEAGDAARRAQALVRAAEKESDDDNIVVEADEAVSVHGDAILSERLSRKVGVFRRTEALRAMAKSSIERGEATEAVRMLERASEIATPEQRDAVSTELNTALVAAGRGEEAVLRELDRSDMPKPERAVRWAELARLRDERGDAPGAADALLQAATEEPTSTRWSAVEAAAEAAGRDHIRVDALRQLVSLARAGTGGDEGQRSLLKRLARAEGARGSLAAAEAAWREVIEVDPSDAEADVAIEALLVARGSFDELALHLGERAARLSKSGAADDRDKLRAVRLRRAAILEQRLGRLEDACKELEQLLLDNPNHPSALRWVADLYERLGEPDKALPALDRLFASASEELEYVSLGVRRVRALLASGDVERASKAIRDLRSHVPNVIPVAEVRVEVARATSDPRELSDALHELARISVDEPRMRSELLVEAAQAAARAGDSESSLTRAREAARLAPEAASTQLFARGLEYRLRGAGTKDDAIATIASLGGESVQGEQPLEPEDIALRAFLIAEAEDVVHGVESGVSEATLKRCLTSVGPQPLVALGLAERAAKGGRHEEAYRFFTEAVYGNLLGLRRPGKVALAAAESASLAGDDASTQRFLNEAAKDPETRIDALRRVAKSALARDETVKARTILRSLAEGLTGGDRAEILAELGRALLASSNPSERIEGDRTMREAIEVAPPAVVQALKQELEGFRSRPPSLSAMAAVHEAPPEAGPAAEPEEPRAPVTERAGSAAPRARLSMEIPGIPKIPPPPPVLSAAWGVTATEDEEQSIHSVRHPPFGSERPPPTEMMSSAPEHIPSERPPMTERASRPPMPSVPPKSLSAPPRASSAPPAATSISEIPTTPAGKVAKARARLVHGSRDEAERLLTEALREGSIDAADLLDQMLCDEPSRRGALIKVRRQAVELNPGNTKRLLALRDAARADQNTNYVRAIDHVLRSFDSGGLGPLAPPPLSAQSAQPGILTLLTRHSHEPAGESFGICWEGAPAIFARSPSAAGMNGLERVVPGPTSAVSRLYEVALRLLDTPRFALFHKRPSNLGRPKKSGEIAFEEEESPLTLSIALLQTPAAILSGDAREDSADLRWILGSALSCVLPQNALVLGLGREEAKALWSVIVAAFGPPGLVTIDRKDAQLADLLWQTLAPRTQRRLKELLTSSEMTPFELVLERARQSGRRVGMFLTGDFAHAAERVLADFPQANAAELQRPGGLEKLCAQLPSLADLLRLAVRPEYADARWHLPTPASQRLASGRLPPV